MLLTPERKSQKGQAEPGEEGITQDTEAGGL